MIMEQERLVCINCGHYLNERSCKVKCARCGYFEDCSDGGNDHPNVDRNASTSDRTLWRRK